MDRLLTPILGAAIVALLAMDALVKRGSEWRAPDSMTLDPRHIVEIAPVKLDSQMAKLIAEASKT